MAGNANSGRSPLPASVHILRGDPSKQGMAALMEAARQPAVPVAVPPKPDFLSEEGAQEWDRVTEALLALGWISTLDMMALATYCEAVGDWVRFRRKIAELNSQLDHAGDVQTFKTGAKQLSVWRQLANDAESRANKAGAAFGFTPISRRAMKALAPQGELFPNEPRDALDQYFS